MDTEFKGKWNQVKGQFKQEYGQLTDDDVTYVEGKEDEFWGKLQEKIGQTKDQIKAKIHEWTS